MTLEPGTRIDDYEVLRLLGQGGMGEVYLARDTRLGREVAIKVMPADSLADPQRQKRFEREARAASRLTHSNAAVVYGFGQWDGGAYIAIEYIDGETLADRIVRGPAGAVELADIAIQVAEVLQEAHEKGIIHRDLKPGNIMLTKAGRVKLVDFGLASVVREADTPDTVSMLTEAGTLLGTVAYMSPEQVLGKSLDARSDLFSLGGVLYELATGRRPFAGNNKTEVISRIIASTPEAVARWNYDIPLELDRIIRKCLEKSVDDRYQSAREIAIDLRHWRRGNSTVAVPAPPVPSRVGRRRALIAGGALAGLGLAAWSGYRWLLPAEARSLAILPFLNESQPENEYLSDGLTEALINLSAVSEGLRVIARSAVYRFKRADDPIRIGKDLNVAAVVVGRMTVVADLVRVSAEMVDVATSRQLWNRRVETPLASLQSLPSKLLEDILRALGVKRSGKAPAATRATDAEAYRLYLKGRYAWNKRVPDAYNQAVDYFKKAIDTDPTFALPYAGLADVYARQHGVIPAREISPLAKAAAEKAIELDPALAEAHAALGFVEMHYDWAWPAAEAAFQRSIELSPSYPSAHSYYARLLTARKRFSEAIAEQRKALELDPLSPALAEALGATYYYQRRYDDAERQLRRVLGANKQFVQAAARLGLVQVMQRNYTGAVETLQSSLQMLGEDDYGILADLGLAYAGQRDAAKARDCLARIERIAAKEYVPPVFPAYLHIGLGERDPALRLLEASVEDRSWPVAYFGVEPKLDPVRSDPRFVKLLSAVGLT